MTNRWEVLQLVSLTLTAALGVSLWTVRVALTSRGRRFAGALVSSVEAVTFATTFSRVLESLDSPVRLAAYAAGVATGTWLGLQLEERLMARRSVRDRPGRVGLRDGSHARDLAHRRRPSSTT